VKLYCPKCGTVLERDMVITEKEMNVWRLWAKGMSVKQIGDELGIPDKTVGSRKYSLSQKLGIIGQATPASRITRIWIERGMQ